MLWVGFSRSKAAAVVVVVAAEDEEEEADVEEVDDAKCAADSVSGCEVRMKKIIDKINEMMMCSHQ